MRLSSVYTMIKSRANREELYCTAEYWDSKAKSFEGTSVSMWPNTHLNEHYHREQTNWLDGNIGPLAGKRVLDAGCGSGRLSRYYASKGAQVVGFDFSGSSIDVARRQSQGANPTYRVQSVFDLHERNAYEIVITWGMLTVACRNRAELISGLKNLQKALVPGGRFLLMEPIHKGFLHRVLNMSLNDFCAAMQESGFKIQSVTHLHFWPMRAALAYIGLPRSITRVGYHTGQALMTLPGMRSMGDYKAIVALA